MTEQRTTTHNLPSLTTSFVGRQSEIAAIIKLLDAPTCHLLTLVGPGGVGKTRLAIEVARHKQEQFAHGVWFVPLAPLTVPDQIPAAIIKELQIQLIGEAGSSQELLTVLRDKELLLVLDNFEHLLAAVGLIEDILRAAPRVKVVVTSRATLNMQVEWVQPVTGMDYPASDTDVNLENFSAVKLFAERARRVRPDFSLMQARNCTIQICQLVEGMPLALEMAAAWLKTIPCKAIGNQIQRDLDFLASSQRDIPERHRSIRAVFDYSWMLLTLQEQQAFPRFSVFRGGCTLEAAAAVTGASLPIMAALVEKSLLTLEPSGRYGLHELLRQYAEEKLIASGEWETVRSIHASYYCRFVSEREADLKGFRQVETLDELEQDLENVRSAWLWALDQRDFNAIDLALESLHRFCQARIRHQDSSELFEQAYQRLAPMGEEPPQRVWGRVLSRLTESDETYTEKTLKHRQQSLEIARKYGDPMEIAVALHWLGEYLNALGRHQEAISSLEESLALLRGLGERPYAARTLNELARCHINKSEPEKAIRYNQEAYQLRREMGDKIGIGWCLYDLGDAHHSMEHTNEAEHCWVEAIKYFGEARSFYSLSAIYDSLHSLAFRLGQLEHAQHWEKEYLDTSKAYHSDPWPVTRARMGVVCALVGDYEGCRSIFASLIEIADTAFLTHWGLAVTAWGLDEPSEARKHLQEMLPLSDFYHAFRFYRQLPCLAVAAVLLPNEGENEWAAELLARAFSGPPQLTGWMKRWPPLTTLHDQLEMKLGEDVFAAAWERGEHLDLDSAIAGLRSHFLRDNDAQQQANQALNDPLTVRELEVLNMIYFGSSNREISTHFVVAESTIKRHINHIYSKLNVESRAQAIARAHELGLLR